LAHFGKLSNVWLLTRRVFREIPLVYPRKSKPPRFREPRAIASFVEPGIYKLEARESTTRSSEELLQIQKKQPSSGELVIMHVYYEEVARYIINRMKFPKEVSFILTGSNLEILKRTRSELKNPNCTIFLVENRGRDIYPFLLLCDLDELTGYSWFWKLHTKRSPHLGSGRVWLDEILDGLIAGRSELAKSKIWAQYPPWLFGHKTLKVTHRKFFNFFWMRTLGKEIMESDVFIPGTMFIGNAGALKAIREQHLIKFMPEEERGQLDGTFVHAVERVLGVIIRRGNGQVLKSGGTFR